MNIIGTKYYTTKMVGSLLNYRASEWASNLPSFSQVNLTSLQSQLAPHISGQVHDEYVLITK